MRLPKASEQALVGPAHTDCRKWVIATDPFSARADQCLLLLAIWCSRSWV